jgi:hypothetical protein
MLDLRRHRRQRRAQIQAVRSQGRLRTAYAEQAALLPRRAAEESPRREPGRQAPEVTRRVPSEPLKLPWAAKRQECASNTDATQREKDRGKPRPAQLCLSRFESLSPSHPSLLRSFGWLTPPLKSANGVLRSSARSEGGLPTKGAPMHYVYLLRSVSHIATTEHLSPSLPPLPC